MNHEGKVQWLTKYAKKKVSVEVRCLTVLASQKQLTLSSASL